jgi:hypothetical protein
MYCYHFFKFEESLVFSKDEKNKKQPFFRLNNDFFAQFSIMRRGI